MENNARTANSGEMEVNKEAYSNGGVENDIIVVDDNAAYTYIGDGDSKRDIIYDEIPDSAKEVLYRTDVDEYNTKYKTSDLQNHNTASGLDITSYSVYSGFKEPGKEPNKVIVGVAGTDTADPKDMTQNLNLLLNRSQYHNRSTEELQATYSGENGTNPYEWGNPNILYEVEIRQKVQALQKYRENGIPIAMVGDSKGGEDAAYLALSFVKTTALGALPGRGNDYDYSAVNLYLTNPKGIRVDDADYDVLKKMADAGKITIEVVYPEILSKFEINHIWREIPYSCKLYTVPSQLRASLDNHTIGNYEEDVYQGFGGNYKFQCDEKPSEIYEWMDSADPALGVKLEVKVGYRYVVSRITDKSGKTMSVNDYFFEEQIRKVERLRNEMIERTQAYNKIIDEPLLDYFTQEVGKQKYRLEEKHKQWISKSTSFEMYYEEHKGLVDSGEKTRVLLERDYEDELSKHVEDESDAYKTVVQNRVEEHIHAYKARVHNQVSRLVQTIHRIDTEMLPSLRESHQTFMKSQEQIKFIVEKRN